MKMENKTCLEYVWIGGDKELRSKTRVMEKYSPLLDDLPVWNFDGSSTGQATGEDSEVLLKPVRVFIDPFRDNGKIVLCDTYTASGEVHPTNHRKWANDIFNTNLELKPWFGLEQEYFMIDRTSGNPLGFAQRGEGYSELAFDMGASPRW